MNKLKIMIAGWLIIPLLSCQSVPVKNDVVISKDCSTISSDFNECRKRLVKCNDTLKEEMSFLDSVNKQIEREKILSTLKGIGIGGGIVAIISLCGIAGVLIDKAVKK